MVFGALAWRWHRSRVRGFARFCGVTQLRTECPGTLRWVIRMRPGTRPLPTLCPELGDMQSRASRVFHAKLVGRDDLLVH